ncbi:MAG: ribbon-helix-helix protein, CopG family [Candidatus Gastranaerophilales bacterium]|nr:ribbon-helix-helix protein, CopG family [Candidatus Gastranaerophilales bacterium]MCM1339565.1 ribbon-helix-helix protein, CopG family [Muribaculaceae bacterium]
MNTRITVRLDEELSKLLSQIQNKSIFNLSGLIREALKAKLNDFINIDNSEDLGSLEKDER